MTGLKIAKFKITGGRALDGQVKISGAKNAALPILLSTILTDEKVCLKNVPDLADVKTSFKLLEDLGKKCFYDADKGEAVIEKGVTSHVASYELVKTMRASIMALGPLVAYAGSAEVSLPGGCAIGARPVDLHIKGLKEMGAQIKLDDGYIKANAIGKGRLHGGHIIMDKVSVTGTENLMMAATLAEGVSIIENAALEPEVVDLANCLNKMGAKIKGAGSSRIEIEGVEKLHGCDHSVVADRIEAGTYLIAGIATHGIVTCLDTLPSTLESVLQKLRQANALVTVDGTNITVDMRNRQIKPVDVVTAPHPGFPTDMQAQFMAALAVAEGSSTVTETVFENRLMHVAELNKMGANIRIDGKSAIVNGVKQLHGAEVNATDLRAGAAMIIAGLVADGKTVIGETKHLYRGYENLIGKLQGIGVKVYEE